MADLFAVGFDDERSAAGAAELVAADDELGIGADAAAVIVRGGDGGYAVRTQHHALPTATNWAMLWEPLFAGLFFVPVLGMPVGPGLEALINRALITAGEPRFTERVQAMLQPGTSALFLVGDGIEVERLSELLATFSGRILIAPLPAAAVRELQEQLHGAGS